MTQSKMNTIPKTIDDVIERAAGHLPNGYVIIIKIENGGYDVSLEMPDGSELESVDGGDGIRSDINEAICIALGFLPLPPTPKE
jgi:hypothetical protein